MTKNMSSSQTHPTILQDLLRVQYSISSRMRQREQASKDGRKYHRTGLDTLTLLTPLSTALHCRWFGIHWVIAISLSLILTHMCAQEIAHQDFCQRFRKGTMA